MQGDVPEPATLNPALDVCEAAYYLVHSMDGGNEAFQERDRKAAINLRDAAATTGLRRIVYLGGLGRGEGPWRI